MAACRRTNGNLDSKPGPDHGLFQRLYERNTIVLVTHEADIAAFARRVIHLKDGRVEKDLIPAGSRS